MIVVLAARFACQCDVLGGIARTYLRVRFVSHLDCRVRLIGA